MNVVYGKDRGMVREGLDLVLDDTTIRFELSIAGRYTAHLPYATRKIIQDNTLDVLMDYLSQQPITEYKWYDIDGRQIIPHLQDRVSIVVVDKPEALA